MELSRFVRVVVEFAEGAKGWGTGYRVGPGKVLTAEHVIRGAAEIKLQFVAENGSPRQVKARCCWPLGKPELDAAVLEFEENSAAATSVVPLAESALERAASWESRGCASAVRQAQQVHGSMVGLSGTVYGFGSGSVTLELTVEAPPREITDWQGVSGAPVFVGGRLAGVVFKARKVFEGRRLDAVPIHLLLREEGFRSALGIAEEPEKQGRLLEEARGLLEASLPACAVIAKAAAKRRLESWQRRLDEGGPAAGAPAFCRPRATSTFRGRSRSCRHRQRSGSIPRVLRAWRSS